MPIRNQSIFKSETQYKIKFFYIRDQTINSHTTPKESASLRFQTQWIHTDRNQLNLESNLQENGIGGFDQSGASILDYFG